MPKPSPARYRPTNWSAYKAALRKRGRFFNVVDLVNKFDAEGRLNTMGRAVASRSKTGRGVATVPISLLVPQVRLRKRLDLAQDAERSVDSMPGLIVANWVEDKI